MHGAILRDHLSDAFLDRVRTFYAAAIASARDAGPIWQPINAKRADVHAALVADNNTKLRAIFENPSKTDLYLGMDPLCLSSGATPITADQFLPTALGGQRAAMAQHQAEVLLGLIKRLRGRAVVEIGPGMGRLAYYAFKAGITDYTTIDLPLGAVGQACFIGAALGPDVVSFENEVDRSAPIRLCSNKPSRKFSLALNVDSITEMPPAIAFDYVAWIAGHAPVFLSVNHEQNLFTVAELVSKLKLGDREHRRQAALWPMPYFEEVYAMKGSAPRASRLRYMAFRAHIGLRTRLTR